MRIVRVNARGKVKYGILADNVVQGIRGSPFARFRRFGGLFPLDGSTYRLDEVRLLAPCLPSKIVCLGLNYRSHAEEIKLPLPSEPLILLKPSTAVVGPDDKIILSSLSRRVDYEGELAVAIGMKAKDVPESKAKKYVMGYTCCNDVSDRDVSGADGQWTRGKCYDTFAPIGPWIETEVDPDDLGIETYLNGKLRQSSRTGDLVFGVSRIISFVSNVMTLLPGDVIATGTPSGVGQIRPGDVVEVRIQSIGTLRNSVVGPK